MEKQNRPKTLMLIFIIIASIVVLGIGLGLLYSSLPQHHPQKNKQSCESVGGDWSYEQEGICLLSYKETDEICTDGGQCKSGVCFPPQLTKKQKDDLNAGPLKNIVGTCYPDALVKGCVKQVIRGTISNQSMCLKD